MVIGLIGMGVLGLLALFLINSYYKDKTGVNAPLPVSTFPSR